MKRRNEVTQEQAKDILQQQGLQGTEFWMDTDHAFVFKTHGHRTFEWAEVHKTSGHVEYGFRNKNAGECV